MPSPRDLLVSRLLLALSYVASRLPAGWYGLSHRAASGSQVEQKGKLFLSLCLSHICCWFITKVSHEVGQCQGGGERESDLDERSWETALQRALTQRP